MTMPVKYFAPKVSLIFPPRDDRGQIMKKLNVCSADSYLYPRSRFKLFGFPNLLTSTVPCEGYSRNALCTLYVISTFVLMKDYYSLIAPALSWSIRSIFMFVIYSC